MKAITLYQPWAWLVEAAEKRIITTDWTADHRGLLAIHAHRHPSPGGRLFMTTPIFQELVRSHAGALLAHGAMIAYANLVDVQRFYTRDDIGYLLKEYGARHEADVGEYTLGRYAMILRNVRQLVPAVPQQVGDLGLWDWQPPPDLVFGGQQLVMPVVHHPLAS